MLICRFKRFVLKILIPTWNDILLALHNSGNPFYRTPEEKRLGVNRPDLYEHRIVLLFDFFPARLISYNKYGVNYIKAPTRNIMLGVLYSFPCKVRQLLRYRQ